MKARQPGKFGQPGKAGREAQPPSSGAQIARTPEQQLLNLLTKACNKKEPEVTNLWQGLCY